MRRLRSLALGQNPVCALSGQTIIIYQGFIWQASWGKIAFPTPDMYTANTLQALKGVAIKDSATRPQHQSCSYTFLYSYSMCLN